MRRVYFIGVLAMLVILVATSSAFAWDEEILNGHYSYRSKDLSISFDWKLNGITRLRINSRDFSDNQVSLDHFGDTECYQIRVRESQTQTKIIRLVFLVRKKNVAFVSGYFAELSNLTEDGDFKVAFVRAIVMRYKPLSPKELE